jgi:hypothetical protein
MIHLMAAETGRQCHSLKSTIVLKGKHEQDIIAHEGSVSSSSDL